MIFTLIEQGFTSEAGQIALAHMKGLHEAHGAHLLPKAQIHTLSCFVVATVRAIKNLSQKVTDEEILAITRFYQELGH